MRPDADLVHAASVREGLWSAKCGGVGWLAPLADPEYPDQVTCSDCREGSAAPKIPTQAEVLAWVAERWPGYTAPVWRAIKMGEEAGEVLGAVTKAELGLKPESEIAVETAQTVLCAMSLAESVGFDLWAAVAADWETMKTRTWSPS